MQHGPSPRLIFSKAFSANPFGGTLGYTLNSSLTGKAKPNMPIDRSNTEPRTSGESRRDFLYLTTGTLAATGMLAATWPFIDSLNPSAEVEALSRVYIDLSPIAPGERITVTWRGEPVFISHRTPAEIAAARADDDLDLPDPEADHQRVQRAAWLVVTGVCTHLGCVLDGQTRLPKSALRRPWHNGVYSGQRGRWDGWFCPCHGSAFDTSGRVRAGPAPRNLTVPPHRFLDDTTMVID